MLVYGVFLLAFVVSVLAVGVMIPVAKLAGVVDLPAGHKAHREPVPYVGGVGVMAALLSFVAVAAYGLVTVTDAVLGSLLIAGFAVFLTGLADDRWQLSSRVRLVIETGAAAVMIAGAGVVLRDLGGLIPGMPLALGVVGIPVTIFGMLSVTNALNMIDGVDGLSGSLSLVSLSLLGAAALLGGAESGALMSLALAGGILGFLVFNMRCCGRRSASAYLGDNGSMLVGFMLGWLFIDLSQGPNAVIAPVTALYLFSVPLFDSAMAIIRRLWMGKSPFHPDRSHLHHLLLDAGASVQSAVNVIVMLHVGMGVMGLSGHYLGVPEWLMFGAYVGAFLVYGYAISRPWRFVPVVRRLLVRSGVTLEHGTRVFVGRVDPTQAPTVLARINEVVRHGADIRTFCESPSGDDRQQVHFVVELDSWYAVRPTINRLRRRLAMSGAFEIRQFYQRSPANDRRLADHEIKRELRRRERRGSYPVRELRDLRIRQNCVPEKATSRPLAA